MFTTHGISRWSKTTRALRLECPRPNRGVLNGCVFWENPKTDLWSQIIWILHQKTEDPKKDHLAWQQHFLVLLMMREIEKTTTTDPRGEGAFYSRNVCVWTEIRTLSVWMVKCHDLRLVAHDSRKQKSYHLNWPLG